ncbi:RNA methyltransferase [Collinsella tanakaei]|uniref:TrmH family RNA methyltransferase n=1 Tax=Collinsella tanakaei TaxID=626935 RepID=UPI00195A6EAC|nr:RNA methyltransferase [Collinsella tanakaei]MBM6756351.1 RNA methyltransferase [Collinsella tanakaei]MBM6867609.1 RNA methyltransferase [Collinsella tanakaei]
MAVSPQIIRIDTLVDERLDAYCRLTERELRSVLEPEKGIFIAESAKVIERAVAAGLEPVSFLMGERWLDQLMPLLERVTTERPEADIPVFVAPMELMERLTGFTVTRGALAAFRRPVLAPAPAFLAGLVERAEGRPVRVCVLEGIVDHTNVGAIFRSAAALNVDGILVSPTCCDPLYRRAVRVSMGTVFQVPWTRIGSEARVWPHDGLADLHEAGFTCAAMALADDSRSLDDPALHDIERLALFMGTEGAGLQAKTIHGADLTIRIPMAHGVDSLNVAAASAVAFWQLCPHADNGYHYRPGMFA